MSKSHGQFAIIPARALDDVRFDDHEKHLRVLLVLGTHADRDGWCWPSLKTMAARLGVTAPTISTIVRDLEKWGYVLIVRSVSIPGQPNQSNRYRVIHDAELPKEFERPEEPPIKEPSTPILDPIKPPCTPTLDPIKPPSTPILQNVPSNAPLNDPYSGASAPPEEPDMTIYCDCVAPILTQARPGFCLRCNHPTRPPEQRVPFDELDREDRPTKKNVVPKGAPKPKAPSTTYNLARAIAGVCMVNFTEGTQGRYLKAAKNLLKLDKTAAPEKVQEMYGVHVGSWYYEQHWKGKLRQAPNTGIILETWNRWGAPVERRIATLEEIRANQKANREAEG